MLERNETATLAGLLNLIAKMMLCASREDHANLESLASELCREHLRANGRIITARVRPDGAIAARIKHNPSRHEPAKNERIFDMLFFAAFLLMEWCGTGLAFHVRDAAIDGKDRYYLKLHPPKTKGRTWIRPYASRVVCDALSDADARQEGDHHSYRFAHLSQMETKTGRHLPPGKNGRAAAIAEVCEGLARKHPMGLEGITPDEIAKILSRLLETATAYHSKQREA